MQKRLGILKLVIVKNYLLCRGANGFADLVPQIFLACPGGIGLEPLGCAGLGGATHDVVPTAKIKSDRQILSDFITVFS